VGAVPVVADADRCTFNISVEDFKSKITKKTKAIIVPHLFGLPADIDEILSRGIPVIEDCAQSAGCRYKTHYTGSFGVLSIFSFYATKVLSTGEGGMILSNDDGLIETVRDLRDYDEKESFSVRYNYKMTDIQAALGINQLKRLPYFIERRKEIAGLYDEALRETTVSAPAVPEDREHIYYRYVVSVRNHSEFMEAMRKEGIDCRKPIFKPLHEYLKLPEFPVTAELFQQAVSIPLYPSLKDEEVKTIIDAVKKLLST
jgi:dTDP-4-amino-4,6-dideoxygalactose transaminase